MIYLENSFRTLKSKKATKLGSLASLKKAKGPLALLTNQESSKFPSRTRKASSGKTKPQNFKQKERSLLLFQPQIYENFYFVQV